MENNNNQPKKRYNKTKIIDRKDIERAMKNSKSNKAAARYLSLSYKTYKSIAESFKNEEGKTLFELHKNEFGRGIPKYANRKSRGPALMEILEGTLDTTLVSMKEIKHRLIIEGYIREECSRCRFHEKRVFDQKVPLIVNYVDGNKRNWRLENLEFLCYNCYFIHIGDVFQKRQIEAMEDYKVVKSSPGNFDIARIHEEDVRKAANLDNKYINDHDDRPEDFGDDLIVSNIRR